MAKISLSVVVGYEKVRGRNFANENFSIYLLEGFISWQWRQLYTRTSETRN